MVIKKSSGNVVKKIPAKKLTKEKSRAGSVSSAELEAEISGIESAMGGAEQNRQEVSISASRSIGLLKKGDIITVDGKSYEVDSHHVLIDHGSTKEMALEIFDPKTDKDYQLRYFDDQVETTLEFYELQEIMYIRKSFLKISW